MWLMNYGIKSIDIKYRALILQKAFVTLTQYRLNGKGMIDK